MKITVRQIRAARGLLGWSQRTLAQHAGLSLNAVNNCERELVLPHEQTIARIQSCLEQAGIMFVGRDGVRLTDEILDIKCFEGVHALAEMRQEILARRGEGADILFMGIDERLFARHDDGTLMGDLRAYHAAGLTEKILLAEGDGHFLSPFAEYRWLSPALVGQVPHIIHGDCVMFIFWGDFVRVLRIQHRPMAATFRQQFITFWGRAKIARMAPAYNT